MPASINSLELLLNTHARLDEAVQRRPTGGIERGLKGIIQPCKICPLNQWRVLSQDEGKILKSELNKH